MRTIAGLEEFGARRRLDEHKDELRTVLQAMTFDIPIPKQELARAVVVDWLGAQS